MNFESDQVRRLPQDARDAASPLVLLFYDGFELKARENLSARAYHALRCLARAHWRRLRGKQVETGFYAAFVALVDGLRRLGCDVRINDFELANRMPDYPIGLAGYPSVLERANLPNPVIFGPGDPGYPDTAGQWASQDKVKFVIQPSSWFVDYYRPYCGDKMLRCPVGINLEKLQDARDFPKSVDVLIYDKIRWNREKIVPAVLDRLIRKLESCGLTYSVQEYGKHTQENFFSILATARSMAFLCEHETQGLACEEALAMNVPVFAWDEGQLIDPLQVPFAAPDLRVSTVPYFDARCGLTFTLADLEHRFDQFSGCLESFRPREFIRERLAPDETARVYYAAYQHMINAALA